MNDQLITLRETELSLIFSFINRGSFCQVIGLPGVGREHLFTLLTSNKAVRSHYLGEDEKKYHFVLVDFAQLRQKKTADVIKLLYLELADSLHKREFLEFEEHVHSELTTALSLADEAVLMQAFKRSIEFLTKEKGVRIIFLCDRFEEYVPYVSDELFVSMSTLRNRSEGKCTVVFTLTRPLEHSIEPEYFRDAYDLLAGNRVYMSLYDKEMLDLEIQKFEEEAGYTFAKDMKDEVISLTGGHRRMTLTALEELKRQGLTQRQDIEKVLLESIATRNVSYQLWNCLRPQEHLLLKRQVVKQGEKIELTEDEGKRLQYFEDIGLIKDNSFTMPLFASFVRYRVEHQLDEKLKINEQTGEIFFGEENVTQKFTSSEYKALLYLIKHTGKVVSRDELIDTVWSESATTFGVTDQALDQLIYRIRRKIEDNPSDPRHLKTVKGLGFTFDL